MRAGGNVTVLPSLVRVGGVAPGAAGLIVRVPGGDFLVRFVERHYSPAKVALHVGQAVVVWCGGAPMLARPSALGGRLPARVVLPQNIVLSNASNIFGFV